MYEYIKGQLASLEPTQAVIDCGGVGYLLEISLRDEMIQPLNAVIALAHPAAEVNSFVKTTFFQHVKLLS